MAAKREYKMTEEELQSLLVEVNAPLGRFAGGDKVREICRRLHCDPTTARSVPGKSGHFFTAEPTKDSIVESVRCKLAERAKRGMEKYGVTMDRTDLSELDWLRHAQEEMLDGAVYLEKLIQRAEADYDTRF